MVCHTWLLVYEQVTHSCSKWTIREVRMYIFELFMITSVLHRVVNRGEITMIKLFIDELKLKELYNENNRS